MEQLTGEQMDTNAAAAQEELLTSNIGCDMSLTDVADWWKRWYMKAGHKRLGRILLKFVGENE